MLKPSQKEGASTPSTEPIDAEGGATTDLAIGIAGTFLPMAGHKGYAITFPMEMLLVILSGSACAPSVVGPYAPEGRSGAGHFVLVVDIARRRPLEEFEVDMQHLIAAMKETPRAQGMDEIFYPVELEARHEVETSKNGLPLPEDVVRDLADGASRLRIASPF